MDDCFDVCVDTSVEIPDIAEFDDNVEIEPFNDVLVEESISEHDLSELQNEVDVLEIEPLDETNAISTIINAGAEGLSSPSDLAQIGAALFSPAGSEDAVAQALQAGWEVGVAGSAEMMEATINQHGISPSVEYNEALISQAIEEGVEATGRTEPLTEVFPDNEDIFDGETGINLTDESLRE